MQKQDVLIFMLRRPRPRPRRLAAPPSLRSLVGQTRSAPRNIKKLPLDNYFSCFHVVHMFGIIAVGDRQYKIVPGEACVMERIDAEEGADVSLKGLVLLANDDEVVVDNNALQGYTVSGQVVKQFREDKVIAYKKKRRQGYERKRGHRQYKTLVLIKEIKL